MVTRTAREKINDAFGEALAAATSDSKKFVIAIDGGGSGLKVSLFQLEADGTYRANAVYEKNFPFKGLVEFVNAYAEVVTNCSVLALKNGGFVSGISMGSPGKFMTPANYKNAYGSAKLSHMVITNLGYDPRTIGPEDMGKNCVITDGTAVNLCNADSPMEFDGVNLARLLRHIGPAGIPIEVRNDAEVQALALANNFLLGTHSKTVFFDGAGSGHGTAVLHRDNGRFKSLTDGHLQRIEIRQRLETDQSLQAVSDFVIRFCRESKPHIYAALPEGFAQPDDLLSGDGIMNLVAEIFQQDGLKLVDELVPEKLKEPGVNMVMSRKYFAQEIDDILNGGDVLTTRLNLIAKNNMPERIAHIHARVDAVARYRVDYYESVHSGKMTFVHREAQWTDDDISQVAGFDTIICGGGLSQAEWFQKSVKRELGKRKTGIEIVFPDGDIGRTTKFGTAAVVADAAGKVSPDNLREAQARAAVSTRD